jgi:AcrR family transcriptional regulator
MSAGTTKIDSKQALILAAKKVFAEKGFEGATVKDLADEAGVNVSLISYHFGGKDGIYRACLLQFAEARLDAIERILKPATSESELRVRLRLFADEFVDVHVREPDLCKIIHRDVERMTAIGEEVFRNSFFKVFMTFVDFLKHAEKAKLTKKMKDPQLLASLIFGSLIHFLSTETHRVLLGLPSIKDPKYREDALTAWTDLAVAALGHHASSTQAAKLPSVKQAKSGPQES